LQEILECTTNKFAVSGRSHETGAKAKAKNQASLFEGRIGKKSNKKAATILSIVAAFSSSGYL